MNKILVTSSEGFKGTHIAKQRINYFYKAKKEDTLSCVHVFSYSV